VALTKVSPSLFATTNNITSVTVGGSANTISLTFDGSGVITSATNNAVSVANTAITGNIISSQITSVANTQLTGLIQAAQIGSANATLVTSGTLPTARLPAGSVLQVVQTWDVTQAIFSRSDYIVYLNTAITPTSATSKILVCVNLGCCSSDAAADIGVQLYRNSTAIAAGTGASSTNATFIPLMNQGSADAFTAGFMYLDSPATTSATTYKLMALPNSPRTLYYNRRGADNSYTSSSTVTLMEIAA
jgi:hypothetical protein